MNGKIIGVGILAVLFVSVLTVGVIQAQGEDDQASLKELVVKLDTSISSLRKGDTDGVSELITAAETIYEDSFTSSVESKDPELDNRITQTFSSLASDQNEENIFALRADVLQAAGLVGVSLPALYEYALFIVLGVGVVVSFLITLLNKRLVNWGQVREIKAKVSEFQKEFREARTKKDMKQIHKLQQRQSEITKLQGQMMSQTLKPTIIYMIPLILLWTILGGAFSGWVVAWLPFRIDLPVLGPVVAFGFGLWYFITYLGFSQIFRKILIRE